MPVAVWTAESRSPLGLPAAVTLDAPRPIAWRLPADSTELSATQVMAGLVGIDRTARLLLALSGTSDEWLTRLRGLARAAEWHGVGVILAPAAPRAFSIWDAIDLLDAVSSPHIGWSADVAAIGGIASAAEWVQTLGGQLGELDARGLARPQEFQPLVAAMRRVNYTGMVAFADDAPGRTAARELAALWDQ